MSQIRLGRRRCCGQGRATGEATGCEKNGMCEARGAAGCEEMEWRA